MATLKQTKSKSNITTKARRGRQKFEIKKLEDESSRQVTFSKRRNGLFKKASERCVLCGAKIAGPALRQLGPKFWSINIPG
ncbi:hypothetical protein CRYUN_Cryun06bG0016000 [Craigia yunnanensis]